MCNRLPEIMKNGDAGIFPVYYSLKTKQKHKPIISVTTRYSNQQQSTPRKISCQVQIPDNVGNLYASRCLKVRTTAYTVWSAAMISENTHGDT